MLTLEVESLSIHYLISIQTTCWWNLNKIKWSEPYKIVHFLTKNGNHFWQHVDAILEDVSVTEAIFWCWNINVKTIIFQCSNNDDSPTRVTELNVAPNIADPISLNEKRP